MSCAPPILSHLWFPHPPLPSHALCISTPIVIFQVLMTAFSLLSTQDITTVLAWNQNQNLLFQKLERIMENVVSDNFPQKSGTRLKSKKN